LKINLILTGGREKQEDARKDTPREVQGHRFVYPERLTVYYSNSASMMMSPRDLMIDFGIKSPEIPHDSPDEPTVVDVRIILSLPHAKVLVNRIAGLIEAYE
jgi:hypothetical protein